MLAKIQLVHYFVSKIEMDFKPGSDFESNQVDFSHDIAYREENIVEVIINCDIEDEGGSTLSVRLHGLFEFETSDEVDDDDVRGLCESNTLSILFPYLRSSISDISLKANITPIILPTINIIALLKNGKQDAEGDESIEKERLIEF